MTPDEAMTALGGVKSGVSEAVYQCTEHRIGAAQTGDLVRIAICETSQV
jgi:hypothetical protein